MWLPKGTGWMTSIIAIYCKCTYSSWFLVTLCMYTIVNFIPNYWQRNCFFSKLFFWLVIIKHKVTCVQLFGSWVSLRVRTNFRILPARPREVSSIAGFGVYCVVCTRRFYSRFGFAKTYYAISWVVIRPNFILKQSLDLAFH